MKIKRWVNYGELGCVPKTIKDVVERAGRLLDKACSTEIIGPVLFQGADGKWYTVVVEAEVVEVTPSLVKERLEESK